MKDFFLDFLFKLLFFVSWLSSSWMFSLVVSGSAETDRTVITLLMVIAVVVVVILVVDVVTAVVVVVAALVVTVVTTTAPLI